MSKRIAVVLLNLGGPDRPESVRPFLFNLFNDPAIIRLPAILRTPLAYLIARRRTAAAQENYDRMGGGSPLLPNTTAQAAALQNQLQDLGAVRCFTCMRYWHPMSDEIAVTVREFAPDQIILLPLYPQFSTTTTASSSKEWRRAAHSVGLKVPTTDICCYPLQQGFIQAMASSIREQYREAAMFGVPRLLLSAHGLPEKIVRDGDPYQWQCEQTAAAIVRALNIPALDWRSCYQSRVGPLRWIGPATDDEIRRAGAEKKPLVVAPIAFVSEHIETLVELDVEYRHLAESSGVPYYGRAATASTDVGFIAGLAQLVRAALTQENVTAPEGGKKICPPEFSGCPCRNAA
jgi:protoporphyrin/coproporphyrin ferrochelatase